MRRRTDDEPMDLSPLDLGEDPERLDGLVRRIMAAAEPELERRATSHDPFSMLQTWARPVLAAAAAVSMLALGLLQWQGSSVGSQGLMSIAEALDIVGPTYEWLTDERDPTDADMLALLEDWP